MNPKKKNHHLNTEKKIKQKTSILTNLIGF